MHVIPKNNNHVYKEKPNKLTLPTISHSVGSKIKKTLHKTTQNC